MSRQVISPIFLAETKPQPHTLSWNELTQLKQILARLGVTYPEVRPISEPATVGDNLGSVDSPFARAKALFNARQRRSRHFPSTLFAEPAWDILLVLYVHDGLARLRVSDVVQLTGSPATTVLRWLKELEVENLISSNKHYVDARVTMLELTALGRMKMSAYLTESPS